MEAKTRPHTRSIQIPATLETFRNLKHAKRFAIDIGKCVTFFISRKILLVRVMVEQLTIHAIKAASFIFCESLLNIKLFALKNISHLSRRYVDCPVPFSLVMSV